MWGRLTHRYTQTQTLVDACACSNSGGEEERDVLAAYAEAAGDMDAAIESIMLADADDIGRFVHSYILPAIARGEVKRFKALKKYEKRKVVARATDRARPAQNAPPADNSLALAIQARKAANDKVRCTRVCMHVL